MGLSSINNKGLTKFSSASSKEKSTEKLIREQAFSDITDKFKELRPFLIGIAIIEKISESTILAGANLNINGKKLVIPIIYHNGTVDATTFLYNQETDVLMGLTVKVVRMVTSDNASISGEAVSPDNNNLDMGSIHKLFVPPRTFSPKIASGSLLLQMLEKSASLRSALRQKIDSDKDFKSVLVDGYSEDILKIANLDTETPISTEYESFFSKNEILKQAAKEELLKEYFQNGFAINQKPTAISIKLKEPESVSDKILAQVQSGAYESVSKKDKGFFNLFDRNGNKITVAISNQSSGVFKCLTLDGRSVWLEDNKKYVAQPLIGDDAPTLKDFNIRDMDSRTDTFVLLSNNGDLVEILSPIGNINTGLNGYKIDLNGCLNYISISKGAKGNPVELDGTIFVGEHNVKVIRSKDSFPSDTIDPITVTDLDKTANCKNPMTVQHDGVEFLYKNASYSEMDLVDSLLSKGVDKNSIFTLIKEAKEKGSSSLEAVNAKVDMLSKMIMNVASAQEASTSVSPDETMPSNQQEQSPAAPEEAQIPLEGVDDQASPAESQAGSPTQALPPMEGIDDQSLQQPEQQGLDENGMNMSIDTQTLKMALEQLKNSPVMDMSVLSSLALVPEISDVIKEHKNEIRDGVSSIGRILMNLATKRDTIEPNIGKAKYTQVTTSLRAIFIKMTDAYADIYALKTESDVERN